MMIHKIEPHKYYPEFRSQEPKPSDYLLLFDGEKVYLSSRAGETDSSLLYLPTFEEAHALLKCSRPWSAFS